jgi:hypothetical protein
MLLNYEYFYGIESERFIFFRIPKLLITDKRVKNISSESKLLYGLLLIVWACQVGKLLDKSGLIPVPVA